MSDRTQETLFQLPTDPDEFGVLLAPPELVKIDFSALEFESARRAIIEYIKTYYPDDFNDFISNNGVIMLTEAQAYQTANISLRADVLANEGFLPTAESVDAVVNHLALINQSIRRATPAIADIECTVDSPISSDIEIPSGTKITTPGEDGSLITYEIFRAPGDYTSSITIPAGKRGIVAYGIEGEFQTASFTSAGGPNQQVVIYNSNILDAPILITTQSQRSISGINTIITNDWEQTIVIAKAGANDKVFEVRIFEDRMVIMFGDDVNGMAPSMGETINIRYRIGGGTRGRVGSGALDTTVSVTPNPPYNVPVMVTLRNGSPSVSGTDAETLDNAKKRAPREFATHLTAITADDYSQLAGSFSHPTFGTVAKAIATVRTGLNANKVELYVLAEGSGSIPVKPTAGLKQAIQLYFDDINPITDEVDVLDGEIKYVTVNMNVIMNRSADAPSVKLKVDTAVDNFFALQNWAMGQPFYQSQFINTINDIDGVEYVDIFEPSDNILPTNKLADGTVGIGVNEIIALGQKQITYYFNS